MAVVVKKKKLSIIEQLYVFEIARGMLVTLGHYFKNLFDPNGLPTLSYPEEKRVLGKNYRGLHRLLKKETGELKCTACKLCVTACPSHCITVVAELNEEGKSKKTPAQYDIDINRCIFCGYCVEACPFDAIDMSSGKYELASRTTAEQIYTKEKLSSY